MIRDTEDLALHAARSARLCLGAPPWSWEDWEDMIQAARLALWRTPAGLSDAQRFTHARYAVIAAYHDHLGYNPARTVPLSAARAVAEPDPDGGTSLAPHMVVTLTQLFLGDRRQRHGRAVAGALRQVQIVDLLLQGYRNDAIALELGMTVNAVKRARASIKTSLAAHAVKLGRLTASEANAITRARTADSYDRRWARRRYASHRARREG